MRSVDAWIICVIHKCESIQKTTRVSFLEPLLQSMACIGETTVVSLHCQLSLAPLLQSMAVVLHPQ